MEYIGQYSDRQVFYLSIQQKNWVDDLPTDNWVVLPVSYDTELDLIQYIVKSCLEKNVTYVCATGKDCELIHDTFDYYIVKNKLDKGESVESPDDFEYSPPTTWDDNIDEGFWFALTCAFHPYTEITKVICLDIKENGVKGKLVDLLIKINSGWLPPDTDE